MKNVEYVYEPNNKRICAGKVQEGIAINKEKKRESVVNFWLGAWTIRGGNHGRRTNS